MTLLNVSGIGPKGRWHYWTKHLGGLYQAIAVKTWNF